MDDSARINRAQELSRRWGERLDHFKMPCPLCRGVLHFQGVYYDRLYEFAEDEAGVINPIDVMPISFICDRCGYTAEFDSELFNPAFLARLEGASEEQIEDLQLRDYRVLLPLSGAERSHTLLDLATALAGEESGQVVVLNIGQENLLEEKIKHYVPAPGKPAPHLLEENPVGNLGHSLTLAAAQHQCSLLLIDAHTWLPEGLIPVTDTVTQNVACDVAAVSDRGLYSVNRIVLVTGGGPNARAAAPYALKMAEAFDAELHFLYVASATVPNARLEGERRIADMMASLEIPPHLRTETRVLLSNKIVQTLVEETGQYDLVIMGASPRDWRGRIRPDSISAKVARNCSVTSIMVRSRGSLISSWFNRVFG